MEFIKACKTLSGKPDKKAQLYVFFCVGEEDLSTLESDTCNYNGAALYGDEKEYYVNNVKEISKLQNAGKIVVLDRSGNEIKTDDIGVYWGLYGSNCLHVVTDWLIGNAQ